MLVVMWGGGEGEERQGEGGGGGGREADRLTQTRRQIKAEKTKFLRQMEIETKIIRERRERGGGGR